MEPDFDVDSAAADIASDLGFGSNEPEEIQTEETPPPEAAEEAPPEQVDPYRESRIYSHAKLPFSAYF